MRLRLLTSLWALAAAALMTLLLAAPVRAAAMKVWWDTFEDNNTNGWVFVQNGVAFAVDATTGYAGTHSLKITGNANVNQWGSATSRAIRLDLTSDYTIQFGFKWAAFKWAKFLSFGHIRLLLDQPANPMLYDPDGTGTYTGHPVGSSAVNTYMPQNLWVLVTVHCRPSVRQYWVFVNGTLVGTVNYGAAMVPTNSFQFEDGAVNTYILTAWYDEFALWALQDPTTVSWIVPGTVADPENTVNWAQPPPVPFHGQYQLPDCGIAAISEANSPTKASNDNHRCMVASLAMVFDRFHQIPPAVQLPNAQEEIAAASNTNDRDSWGAGLWTGTTMSDCRRAAHFSILTKALTATRANAPPAGKPRKPGAFGYTWRDLGYTAVDSVWTKVAAQDSIDFAGGGRPKIFERLIASGYPMMVCFTPPADWYQQGIPDPNQGEQDTLSHVKPDSTAEGHCVVVIGYDNLGGQGGNPYPAATPAVLIHDPGWAKAKWYTQAYFFNQVWKFGRFLFAAPWEVMWLSIGTVAQNAAFDGSALVTYTGPKPLTGLYPVTAQAKLTMNGIGLQGAEVATHNLANITRTGDFDQTTFKLKGPAGFVFGGAWVKCSGYGTLNSVASTSYAGYADKIGNKIQAGYTIIIFPPPKSWDLGHWGWPYGGYWWCGGSGGTGLHIAEMGTGTVDVQALVANMGLNTTPPTALMNFYWGDPTVTEKAPGRNLFATMPIPTLAPGDTVRIHAPWTRPPENSMLESFFDVFTQIDFVSDPPYDAWPQDENNYAALSEYTFDVDGGGGGGGGGAAMWFRVQNPEPTLMNMALVVEREEEAEHWTVALTDSLGGALPEGVPMPVPPGGSYRARVTVTPDGQDSLGRVHVLGWLYTPGMVFLRQTGGITLDITWHPPLLGVGPGGRATLALAQNRPNPFRSTTAIHYSIPRDGPVSLRVYDVAGRLVAALVEGTQSAGPHHVVWDGSGAGGVRLRPGLYLCRMEAPGVGGVTKRMVMLR